MYSKDHFYFAIFDSQVNYICQSYIWPKPRNAVSRIVILQKKALRIKNFQSTDSHSTPVFKSNHILKFEDKLLRKSV